MHTVHLITLNIELRKIYDGKLITIFKINTNENDCNKDVQSMHD